MNWYLKVFKQYANFTGRARREEYWMFILFNFIALIITALLDFLLVSITDGQIPYGFITIMYSFIIFIPSLAVTVRRLHDTGRSAWWFLINLVPLGGIWLFILMLLDSQSGVNRFGVNPKEESTRENDKTKSAAVALIITSSIWLATIIIPDIVTICTYGFYGYPDINGFYPTSAFAIIYQHLHYLIPIALLILGISLLCKNSKKQFAAIFLIIAGVIRLYIQTKLFINASSIFTDLLMFNINAILEILYVIIPIALIVLGLSMLRVNNKPIIDTKIASLSLFVAGFFWIFKLIYQVIVMPILLITVLGYHHNSDSIFLIFAGIIVPVSLIVLAFALKQNKENIPVEDERVLECRRIYNENRPPIKMGFAIVNICIGVILFLSSIMMFFDRDIRGYALIPLTVSLFLWITGICGLVVRKRHTNDNLTKNMSILTIIAFLLSCAIIAFVIITPIMVEIFD